jgi:hypothetical protein
LVESIYEGCLMCELDLRHLTTANQKLGFAVRKTSPFPPVKSSAACSH